MENVGFQPSGDEIERALMDLGPLLGVTIKEEVSDDLSDAASASAPPPNLNASNLVTEGVEGAENGKDAPAEGADSLAPAAGAAPPAAARCVLCRAALAQQDGTPKLMECLHSACEPCINAKLEERQASSRDFLGAERITIMCPECRLQCQVANMIDQRFVLEKMAVEQAGSSAAVSGDQQCSSCEETEPATSYCNDCAEFICDNCVLAHQRLKITKDHTIKSKDEALAELVAAQAPRAAHDMFCREHVQERLSLFCETCDRLTCRDCQLQHHRDHKYQFSSEMAAQARSNVAALLGEVSYKRVLLGSAMKVIRERQQLIADKKRALVTDITQTVVKLTNAINTRGKQLVLRLNEVCDAKQRTLSEKKDALQQLAAITDHCVGFVTSALHQGSDTAVLYSKRAVCAHLQRIKSRRADIPNPEIPVRISLALDKLPDLLRVLSSIGAIVVDGKVDGAGGAGGAAQGPYHPPAPAAPPAPGPAPAAGPPAPAPPAPSPGNPAHSAVVALQHVAMHQSYVQGMSGGGAGGPGAGGGAGGQNGAGGGYLVPARRQHHQHAHPHPHVTSSTHPQHLHGMSELNLRGLLNAQAQRARPAPPPHSSHSSHSAMHHAYHHMMGAYASNAFGTNGGGLSPAASLAGLAALGPGGGPGGPGGPGGGGSGRRSGGPRTPSPAPAPQYYHQPAKWHIPQQARPTAPGVADNLAMGVDFKITLGRARGVGGGPGGGGGAGHGPAGASPPLAPPAPVTSSISNTPSPSLNGGGSGALELDAVCAESVQDLMATIAKLDSNGVQVVREPAPPPGLPPARSPAPGAPGPPRASPQPSVHSSTDVELAVKPVEASGAGDPNEDWCAVCMDGGELMCCDKCPKVFHQYCHIPTIEKLPDESESWQCLLCVDLSEIPPDGPPRGPGLTPRLQRVVERLTLELYCQYETSLPFREATPLYHDKIPMPMCLDTIRARLQPGAPQRYSHVAHFVADCRLLFRNATTYNPPDSSLYKDAKRLEEFFEAQLVKWLPEHAAAPDAGPPLTPPGPPPGPPPPATWAELLGPPSKRPRC